MRAPLSRLLLVVGSLAVASTAGAAAKAPHETPSLTLYEKPDFTGRHVGFHGQADTARQAFDAKSARSTGVWTLCESRDPAGKCQTVTGAAATLKLTPAIVRPGVDAVALYEEPGLKGRRVLYSFASDQPPPFPAKSARTWGGAWSLCDAAGAHCQVIDSERPAAVDVKVGLVKPGRPQEKLQLALAPPAPSYPAPAAAPPEPPAPQIAEAPPPPEAAPPPEDMPPPPVLAEAPPPPAEAEPASPYVDIPLPPRERDAPPPVVEIPAPPRETLPPNAVRRVSYVCEDGRGLTVLFDDRDDSAMVLAADRNPVALRRSQAEEAGGFFYEGSGHVLFGAGGRAGYASDGAEPVDCYARGARRQLSYRDDGPRQPEYRRGDGDD